VLRLYGVIVFRRKPGDESDGPHIKGTVSLQIAWTVIPLIVVMGFGVWAAGHLNEITAADPEERVVRVTGFQLGWALSIPNMA